MTGLNNRLLVNLQEKITESKSQATIASARTVANKGNEIIEESSEGGSKNTRNDSKESNALTGSQLTLSSILNEGNDRKRKLSTIQKEQAGLYRPSTTKFKSAFFDLGTQSDDIESSARLFQSNQPPNNPKVISVEGVDDV